MCPDDDVLWLLRFSLRCLSWGVRQKLLVHTDRKLYTQLLGPAPLEHPQGHLCVKPASWPVQWRLPVAFSSADGRPHPQ